MEKKRRADRLIVYMRWLVIIVGLVTTSDYLPASHMAVIFSIAALYNGILTWGISDAGRYMRYGRKMGSTARALDMVVVTVVVALIKSDRSMAYLLYWFVLVSYGFANADLRHLAGVTAGVLVANTAGSFYALSHSGSASECLRMLCIRSAVLVTGSLVSAFIARTRAQDDLAVERGAHLHAILDYGARLTSFRSVHEMALYVLKTVVSETGASRAQLFLRNEDTQELECEATYESGENPGESPEVEPNTPAGDPASAQSYAAWVASSGRELLVHVGGKAGDEAKPDADDRPAVAMPMLWQSSGGDAGSSVLGVLVVWGHAEENFGEDEVHIVRIFAAMSAAAMVSLRLYTNMQKSFLRTLQSLAKGLEARDEYTRGHSARVMEVACLIGERLGLSPESIELLRNASLLHDIGKIGVPDAVLRKAGKLTSDEWEVMRKHPTVSEEICRPLGLPEEVLFLIKHHHEHLDAKGYPSGLTAQEQPLLQRILVVADSFDAMRSRRPYRDIMPEDELRMELNRAAGRTMDPTVVDILLGLLDGGELEGIYEEHDRMLGILRQKTRTSRQKAA